MFCENLETRRFLTVTLRPPIPPGPSGDPGTLPPECITVTQDSYGKVTISTIDGSQSTNGGSSDDHSMGSWVRAADGQWVYSYSNNGGSSDDGSDGGSSGGSSGVDNNCELNVSVLEQNGTLVITETSTGATFDVTNATGVKIIGTENGDDVFYFGNSIGAIITTDYGSDSITIADTGTGKSNANAGSNADSVNLLVGNRTTISGGGGGDTIFVNSGVGIYNTGAASAIIYANGGDDTIVVYDGTNTISGGDGSDVVIDMGGNNTVSSASVQS